MNRVKRLSVLIMISLLLAGCTASRQDVGVIGGSVVGGLLGSQFGQGSGQVAAVVAGSVLGGLIGGSVGKSMDEQDQARANLALEKNRTGQTTQWSNPDKHASYTVTPTKTYKLAGGQYCREYQMDAVINGKKQKMFGKACRQPDGSWKQV